jgi:hypothetical protein
VVERPQDGSGRAHDWRLLAVLSGMTS